MITTFFDLIHQFRKFLQDGFIYLSFVFYGFEGITFSDIQQYKYKKNNKESIDVNSCWDLDPLYQVAKDAYFEGKNRRKLLTEKCYALHIYSMFCATVVGMIFASLKGKIDGILGITDWLLGITLGFCLFFLIVTILMLVTFYGKDCWAFVVVNEKVVDQQGDKLKKYLVTEYHEATLENDCIIDYLADVVAVARFYFTISLLLLTLSVFIHLRNLMFT
jgi:hypothetical protein